MNVWLRLSATFHEHPKMLSVRSAAGSRADSAELGWYRLLMAAKRYGRWTFASEAHLEYIAGSHYRYVPLYRAAGLLDGLTVHDGDDYNAIKTPAERKSEQRQRDAMSREGVTSQRDTVRDKNVTLDNRQRESTNRETDAPRDENVPNDPWDDPEHEALVWLAKHGCDVRPGNGYHRKLVTAVEVHGVNPLIGMMDRLAAAGTKHGDIKGFLFGAIDALDKHSRPSLAVLEKGDRADDERRAFQARLERTRSQTAELREVLEQKS